MAQKKSYLKGKMILAVDDEEDILDTIAEALETARVDRAQDYRPQSGKLPRSTMTWLSSISWALTG